MMGKTREHVMRALQVLMRVALLGVLGIQPASAQAAPVPSACESPVHRQFDFWLGEWEVEGGQDGKTPVGRSSITTVAKGCALHENWRSAGGGDGQSLNVYDATAKQWTQFWIGADGVILRLAGGWRNGAMVLEGSLPMPAGRTQLQRITWTPLADGRVCQRWETSDDTGKSWQISFLGFYRKAAWPSDSK
jgi:hypothetical protein